MRKKNQFLRFLVFRIFFQAQYFFHTRCFYWFHEDALYTKEIGMLLWNLWEGDKNILQTVQLYKLQVHNFFFMIFFSIHSTSKTTKIILWTIFIEVFIVVMTNNWTRHIIERKMQSIHTSMKTWTWNDRCNIKTSRCFL